MATIKTLASDLRKILIARYRLALLTKGDLNKIGAMVVKEIRDKTAKGISPVSGKRYEAYKVPERYPDRARRRFPRKRRRPVNLRLSLEFMKSLKFEAFRGKIPKLRFTYRTRLSKLKEKGHAEGAGGQPKRPTLPERGQLFSRAITVKIRRAVIAAVRKRTARR